VGYSVYVTAGSHDPKAQKPGKTYTSIMWKGLQMGNSVCVTVKSHDRKAQRHFQISSTQKLPLFSSHYQRRLGHVTNLVAKHLTSTRHIHHSRSSSKNHQSSKYHRKRLFALMYRTVQSSALDVCAPGAANLLKNVDVARSRHDLAVVSVSAQVYICLLVIQKDLVPDAVK
jgi:hypothetical protein